MRTRTLSIPQLRDIRSELEREHNRAGDDDHRSHVIAEAMRRLDSGTYGLCAGCQDAIPFGRLAAIPETPYCVECGRAAGVS